MKKEDLISYLKHKGFKFSNEGEKLLRKDKEDNWEYVDFIRASVYAYDKHNKTITPNILLPNGKKLISKDLIKIQKPDWKLATVIQRKKPKRIKERIKKIEEIYVKKYGSIINFK